MEEIDQDVWARKIFYLNRMAALELTFHNSIEIFWNFNLGHWKL